MAARGSRPLPPGEKKPTKNRGSIDIGGEAGWRCGATPERQPYDVEVVCLAVLDPAEVALAGFLPDVALRGRKRGARHCPLKLGAALHVVAMHPCRWYLAMASQMMYR